MRIRRERQVGEFGFEDDDEDGGWLLMEGQRTVQDAMGRVRRSLRETTPPSCAEQQPPKMVTKLARIRRKCECDQCDEF